MNEREESSKKKSRRRRKPHDQVEVGGMPVLRRFVAGIDIGSREHWVCGPLQENGRRAVRAFETTTSQLEALADWLKEQRVESVAMESTSVYWIPLYELLETRGIEPVLVNAREVRQAPGRPKTDVHDCEWLQRLHSVGFLRGSFRPTDAIVRLRTLLRQENNLVQVRTQCVQWIQKSLDQMNVQVHHAVTDITGATGMAILRAIADGERDAHKLASLRDPRCRKSQAQIAEHLRGNWREEHLFNLRTALRLYDSVQAQIAAYDERMALELDALQPPERKDLAAPRHPNPTKEKAIRIRGNTELRDRLFRLAGVDLFRIDGINAGVVSTVITEVGLDLSKFPTEKAFISWLRLCPPTAISGGKPLKKRRTNLGANRVAAALRMAATTFTRSRTALGAQFRRVARRKDGRVAVFVLARKLAQLLYRMLKYGHDYVDIGADRYEAIVNAQRLAGLEESARSLGYALVPVPDKTTDATARESGAP
jgi:transposase